MWEASLIKIQPHTPRDLVSPSPSNREERARSCARCKAGVQGKESWMGLCSRAQALLSWGHPCPSVASQCLGGSICKMGKQ